jgi:hypothetical protein
MENGGTRTYEVRKDKEQTEEAAMSKETLEEKMDPMKALEKRVLASQREMADLDNLEEIKAMNMRNVKLLSGIVSSTSHSSGGTLHAADAVLSMRDKIYQTPSGPEHDTSYWEEDELLIQSIPFGSKKGKGEVIHRLNEQDEEYEETRRKRDTELLKRQQGELLCEKTVASQTWIQPRIQIKRKRVVDSTDNHLSGKEEYQATQPSDRTIHPDNTSNGLSQSSVLGMLGEYESD